MRGLLVGVFWILALGGILGYAAWNLRRLWRAAKRLGKEGARLAQAPEQAARRLGPWEKEEATPAPFHDFRRRQATEDRARVRAEREAKRATRLERATGRWAEEGDSPYAHFDRKQAKASYDARRKASGRNRRTQ